APLRMNRYLVLCENITPTTCRIRVLLLSPDYATVEEIQRIPPINGWVYRTPSVRGNLMFVATDAESVEIYSAGPPEKADASGFTKVMSASGPLPAGPRGPAYPLAYTERDLLV